MSYDYNGYVQQIANLMVNSTGDVNFTTMLPGMIDYAEQRLYRELDLQTTRISDSTSSLSSGVRTFTTPTDQGAFVVTEQFNVWSGSSLSSAATRNPLTPVTKEYLDFAWPTSTNTGLPLYVAPLNQTTFIVGPAPDQAYVIEVIGTIRPAPLSATNTTTFLTNNLPDLFIAASMVFASAYMRDFGSQSDNPGMSASWEAQYKTLFASANAEELRKRYQSQAWTSQTPNANATPPRR